MRAELEARIAALPGLACRRSRFGDGRSYFVAEREIAHFHGDRRLDVRLTSGRIRELRAAGRLDPRIRTGGPAAHWVTLLLETEHDDELAVETVEEALRANA